MEGDVEERAMKLTLDRLQMLREAGCIEDMRLRAVGGAFRLYATLTYDEAPAIVVRTRDRCPRTFSDTNRALRALQNIGFEQVIVDLADWTNGASATPNASE